MHVLASSCPGDLRALPSFPTRRSSDLLNRRTPSSRYSQVASDSSTCASTSTRNISPPLFNDETIERAASANRYCTARRLSSNEAKVVSSVSSSGVLPNSCVKAGQSFQEHTS